MQRLLEKKTDRFKSHNRKFSYVRESSMKQSDINKNVSKYINLKHCYQNKIYIHS